MGRELLSLFEMSKVVSKRTFDFLFLYNFEMLLITQRIYLKLQPLLYSHKKLNGSCQFINRLCFLYNNNQYSYFQYN